jgi:hypothetical protein
MSETLTNERIHLGKSIESIGNISLFNIIAIILITLIAAVFGELHKYADTVLITSGIILLSLVAYYLYTNFFFSSLATFVIPMVHFFLQLKLIKISNLLAHKFKFNEMVEKGDDLSIYLKIVFWPFFVLPFLFSVLVIIGIFKNFNVGSVAFLGIIGMAFLALFGLTYLILMIRSCLLLRKNGQKLKG